MFKIIQSASLSGAVSLPVQVEVSASTGLPQETIIGLPDTVIKESRSRVKSAILLSEFEFPAMSYVINLAPTDIPKKNISLELAISVAILSITNQIQTNNDYCFIGGLSLDGSIVPIKQLLPIIYHYPNYKNKIFVISKKNEADISPLNDLSIITIDHLKELKDLSKKPIKTVSFLAPKPNPCMGSFDDVKGHYLAKQACAFSIIGRHPLLFVGEPGIGKTMLIERMKDLLPPLNNNQSLENCCTELLLTQQMHYTTTPPYRAPHHSISYAGMIGGKNPPQPGEITRANHGLLFLDEIGEYQRAILDTLREPMETKKIQLSRAGNTIAFPANFLLATAMNPCHCGYQTSTNHMCRCLPHQIQKYWQRISQPFLDRISICLILSPNESNPMHISNDDLKNLIQNGITMAQKRNPNQQPNQQLSIEEIQDMSQISDLTEQRFDDFFKKNGSSMRAKKRLYQLSRTIADGMNDHQIKSEHVSIAIQLNQHHQLPTQKSSWGLRPI